MSKTKIDLKSLTRKQLEALADYLGINHQEISDEELITKIKSKRSTEELFESIKTMPSLTLTGMVGNLMDFWFKAYKINKRATVITTIVLVIAASITAYFIDQNQKNEMADNNLYTADLRERISDLNNAKATLNNLISFIDQQKIAIVKAEENLQKLQETRSKLEPLVQADQQTIEAIFREQEERTKNDIWLERLYGFLIGVTGSFIASLLYGLIKRKTAPNTV